ncbi:MAG: YciI family protein [Chloroflexota bacterium]|nr:YciI family protein [Chloroflexota bacterium]
MPKYMALIYDSESGRPAPDSKEWAEFVQAYGPYTEELMRAGVMKSGDALAPTSTATTVRVRNGQTLTTDGPFAETKEQLGGYYAFECKDLDEAIHWAAKIPGAAVGSVEIRPVVEM